MHPCANFPRPPRACTPTGCKRCCRGRRPRVCPRPARPLHARGAAATPSLLLPALHSFVLLLQHYLLLPGVDAVEAQHVQPKLPLEALRVELVVDKWVREDSEVGVPSVPDVRELLPVANVVVVQKEVSHILQTAQKPQAPYVIATKIDHCQTRELRQVGHGRDHIVVEVEHFICVLLLDLL